MEEAVQSMNNDALKEAVENSKETPGERKMLLDNLFRCHLTRTIAEGDKSDSELVEIVNFAVRSAIQEFCSKTTPLVMLVDIFDTVPISRCEDIFSFVENMIPTWNSHFESSRTHLLRLCNDLLRRLSRTVDTQFCGRILVFLARCLPLTEKSGLNITSMFNVDNLTKYELEIDSPGQVGTTVTASEDMDVEEGEMKEPTTTASSVPVDYALYCKFWQLQNYFTQPQTCYDKLKWKQFYHNANEVLSALSSYKLEPPASSSSGLKRAGDSEESGPEAKKPRTEQDDEVAERLIRNQNLRRKSTTARRHSHTETTDTPPLDVYFAKFLTSQKLLQLQLNDSQFRRYLLVQFLILFQYLTAEVKFKDKKSHSLNDEQTKWVEEMIEKCYSLLGETYPRGTEFAKSIKHILEREERWNEWKNGGCEDFTKRAEKEKMAVFRRCWLLFETFVNPGMTIVFRQPKNKFNTEKLDLGNRELTALWNVCPDNFAACRGSEREFVPKLEDFLEEPLEQADPENKVEEEYKLVNNENFQWRALRLLMRRSPHFWSAVNNNVVTHLNRHLEGLIQKTAADLPKFKEALEAKKAARAKKGEAVADAEAKKAEEAEELEKIAVQPEAGAMDDDELTRQAEPVVSDTHVQELSTLIGSDWIKLASHMGLSQQEISAYKKKQVPEDVCMALLNQWTDQEGSGATMRRLRNLLLEAELFNEEVSAVLQKTESEESASADEASDKP